MARSPQAPCSPADRAGRDALLDYGGIAPSLGPLVEPLSTAQVRWRFHPVYILAAHA
jgi:hypothetical protein